MNLKTLLTALAVVASSCVLASPAAGAAEPVVSINITSPASGSFHKTAPAMYFTKTGVATKVSCSHDDSLPEEFCTNPWNPGPLANGSHTYHADIASGDETEFDSDHVTFTIDNTAPTVTIGGAPTGPYSSATQINLFATIADANPDRVHCRKDGGEWLDCTGLPTVGSIFVNNVSEGAHSYQFKGIDKAGNEAVATYNVTIDRTPPSGSLSTNWGDQTKDNSPAFLVNWSSEIPATRQCRIIGQTEFDYCSGSTWVSPVIADGSHTAELKVVDAAGNQTIAQLSFTLDATMPFVTYGGFENNQTTSLEPEIDFYVDDINPTTARCKFDATDWSQLDACEEGLHKPAAPLALGQHNFWIEAIDSYGNSSSTIYTFEVVAPGTLPGDKPADTPNPGAGPAAAAVSVAGKSGKVKKGKFVNTLTISIKSGAANCGGKLALVVKPAVKKAKAIKRTVALKNVKGACVGTVKLKLAAKFKKKKAAVTVSRAATADFAAVSFKGTLKKL